METDTTPEPLCKPHYSAGGGEEQGGGGGGGGSGKGGGLYSLASFPGSPLHMWGLKIPLVATHAVGAWEWGYV